MTTDPKGTTSQDPFGDNDPLVIEALHKLLWAIGYARKIEQVEAIDSLIQARIAVALETLTNAALGAAEAKE